MTKQEREAFLAGLHVGIISISQEGPGAAHGMNGLGGSMMVGADQVIE